MKKLSFIFSFLLMVSHLLFAMPAEPFPPMPGTQPGAMAPPPGFPANLPMPSPEELEEFEKEMENLSPEEEAEMKESFSEIFQEMFKDFDKEELDKAVKETEALIKQPKEQPFNKKPLITPLPLPTPTKEIVEKKSPVKKVKEPTDIEKNFLASIPVEEQEEKLSLTKEKAFRIKIKEFKDALIQITFALKNENLNSSLQEIEKEHRHYINTIFEKLGNVQSRRFKIRIFFLKDFSELRQQIITALHLIKKYNKRLKEVTRHIYNFKVQQKINEEEELKQLLKTKKLFQLPAHLEKKQLALSEEIKKTFVRFLEPIANDLGVIELAPSMIEAIEAKRKALATKAKSSQRDRGPQARQPLYMGPPSYQTGGSYWNDSSHGGYYPSSYRGPSYAGRSTTPYRSGHQSYGYPSEKEKKSPKESKSKGLSSVGYRPEKEEPEYDLDRMLAEEKRESRASIPPALLTKPIEDLMKLAYDIAGTLIQKVPTHYGVNDPRYEQVIGNQSLLELKTTILALTERKAEWGREFIAPTIIQEVSNLAENEKPILLSKNSKEPSKRDLSKQKKERAKKKQVRERQERARLAEDEELLTKSKAEVSAEYKQQRESIEKYLKPLASEDFIFLMILLSKYHAYEVPGEESNVSPEKLIQGQAAARIILATLPQWPSFISENIPAIIGEKQREVNGMLTNSLLAKLGGSEPPAQAKDPGFPGLANRIHQIQVPIKDGKTTSLLELTTETIKEVELQTVQPKTIEQLIELLGVLVAILQDVGSLRTAPAEKEAISKLFTELKQSKISQVIQKLYLFSFCLFSQIQDEALQVMYQQESVLANNLLVQLNNVIEKLLLVTNNFFEPTSFGFPLPNEFNYKKTMDQKIASGFKLDSFQLSDAVYGHVLESNRIQPMQIDVINSWVWFASEEKNEISFDLEKQILQLKLNRKNYIDGKKIKERYGETRGILLSYMVNGELRRVFAKENGSTITIKIPLDPASVKPMAAPAAPTIQPIDDIQQVQVSDEDDQKKPEPMLSKKQKLVIGGGLALVAAGLIAGGAHARNTQEAGESFAHRIKRMFVSDEAHKKIKIDPKLLSDETFQKAFEELKKIKKLFDTLLATLRKQESKIEKLPEENAKRNQHSGLVETISNQREELIDAIKNLESPSAATNLVTEATKNYDNLGRQVGALLGQSKPLKEKVAVSEVNLEEIGTFYETNDKTENVARFGGFLDEFVATMRTSLSKETQWSPPHPEGRPKTLNPNFFTPGERQTETYTQKLMIPVGSRVAIIGDIHGNLLYLKKNLESLQEKGVFDTNLRLNENCYLIFTGDYADRGPQSTEVWETIMRLKINNPQKVFLLRGNHEEAGIAQVYGFTGSGNLGQNPGELQNKKLGSLLDKVLNAFKILPIALFVGTREEKQFILCCHGAIELKYRPHALLDYESNKLGLFHQKVANLDLTNNNFLWGDFGRLAPQTQSAPTGRGVGLTINTLKLPELLNHHYNNENHKVVAICRGHQHNTNHVGIFNDAGGFDSAASLKIVDTPVFTFMSCGDMYQDGSLDPSGYGIFSPRADGWHLTKVVDTH
jgi:hypothetical protein